jgi:hypothetical protein
MLNPNEYSTSFFELCLRTGEHNIECHKQFKMLAFTQPYNISNLGIFFRLIQGISIKADPDISYVGMGSTYTFKMNTNISNITSSYSIDQEYVKIRVVFDK